MDATIAERPPAKPLAPSALAPRPMWKLEAYWQFEGGGKVKAHADADQLKAALVRAILEAPRDAIGGAVFLPGNMVPIATFKFNI